MRIKINVSSDFEIITNDDDSKINNSSGLKWRWERQWQSWLNIFLLLYFVSSQLLGVFDHKSLAFRSNEDLTKESIITEASKQRNGNKNMLRSSYYVNDHDRNHNDHPSPHRHHQQQNLKQQQQQQQEQQEHQQASYEYLDLEPLEEEERMDKMTKRMEKEERKLKSLSPSRSVYHETNQHHHDKYNDVQKHHYHHQQQQQQQKGKSSTNIWRKSQGKRRKMEEEETNDEDKKAKHEIIGEITMNSIMEVEREERNENENKEEMEMNEEEEEEEEETTAPGNIFNHFDIDFSTVDNGDSSIRRNYNTDAAARLRAALLTDYDKNSFPWEWAWIQNYKNDITNTTGDTLDTYDPENRKGLEVEVGLNFHKIFEVDVTDSRSTADLVVWLRMRWKDPRLAWDPKDYDGMETTWFFIDDGTGGGEMSEIFTPDLYLWNQAESLQTSMANTYATVSNDGTIFWSRPGRLKASCKYNGLKNFPFDDLGCMLEFGSWSRSGLYLRPIRMDGTGISIGGSETAGQSFAEFALVEKAAFAEEVVYPPYPCCPEEDWPVLIYNLTFSRASEPYLRTVILINILLNFGAFACFWMSPAAGERMALAITSVLAAVTSEIVVAERFPLCKELSWYNKFALGSVAFAMAVVIESAVVIYFFFKRGGDDLTPSYIKWIQNRRKRNKDARNNDKETWQQHDGTKSDDSESNEDARNNYEKADSIHSICVHDIFPASRSVSSLQHNGANSDDRENNKDARNNDEDINNNTKKKVAIVTPDSFHDSRAVKWQDDGANNDDNIDDEIYHNSKKEIASRDSFNASRSVRWEDNSYIGRNNSKRECFTSRSSIPTFHSAKKTKRFSDISKTMRGIENSPLLQRLEGGNSNTDETNNYWQKVSEYIDEGARVILPLIYTVFLVVIITCRKTSEF